MKAPLKSRLLSPEFLVYSGACFLLWLIPVFDRLHVESSAVLAFCSFFVAGVQSIRHMGRPFASRIRSSLLWLFVPLIWMSLSMIWAPNCDYARGLLFFLLFVPITVFFAVSLSELLLVRTRRPVLWLVLVGVGVAILGPLFDIGFHPQFYSYNHVFGGVLGPLYETDLVVRPGIFAFRALTLLWGFLFLALVRRHNRATLVLTLSIGAAYMFAGQIGINTPAGYLQGSFSGFVQSEHFDIYYDSTSTSSLERLVDEHEFRYAELTSRLGVEPTGRVISYVYPDADTRARFTGARRTSVAPVWLRDPQVHVEIGSFYQIFPHELVHVFSREFGLPLLHASLHVGLVEGLAVALEPPDGRPSPHALIAAHERAARGDSTWGVGGRLVTSLSPTGFWGGRAAVSYTTTGSFVRFLLDEYQPGAFTRAYATAAFEREYEMPLDSLASRWQAMLKSLPVSHPDVSSQAARQFSVLSLFEAVCPHFVSPRTRSYRLAAREASEGRPDEAERILSEAGIDDFLSAELLEAELSLRHGREGADDYLVTRPDSMRVFREWILAANAAALAFDSVSSRASFDKAGDMLSRFSRSSMDAVAARSALAARPDVFSILIGFRPIEERIEQLEDLLSSSAWSTEEGIALNFILGAYLHSEDRFAEARAHLEDAAAGGYSYASFLALQAAYYTADLIAARTHADASFQQWATDRDMTDLIFNWTERISWKAN